MLLVAGGCSCWLLGCASCRSLRQASLALAGRWRLPSTVAVGGSWRLRKASVIWHGRGNRRQRWCGWLHALARGWCSPSALAAGGLVALGGAFALAIGDGRWRLRALAGGPRLASVWAAGGRCSATRWRCFAWGWRSALALTVGSCRRLPVVCTSCRCWRSATTGASGGVVLAVDYDAGSCRRWRTAGVLRLSGDALLWLWR